MLLGAIPISEADIPSLISDYITIYHQAKE